MKVAVLSESPADEAAIRVLVEGLRGLPVELVDPGFRPRGWPRVRRVVPTVLRHLHYATDANALVVVVDSNNSPLHAPENENDPDVPVSCRLCLLRDDVVATASRLRPRLYGPVQVALGLAVPAIEAWYLCNRDPHASEAQWVTQTSRHTKRTLKQAVYGTDRPSLQLETERAVAEANRLAAGQLRVLEEKFPVGFGSLAEAVRGWHQTG